MRKLALVVLFAGMLFGIASADQDNVGAEIDAVVKDKLAPALKKAAINSVTIAPIVSEDGSIAPSGPGLAQALADALGNDHGIGVVPGSRAVVFGKLFRAPDERSKMPAIRLDITLEIDGKPVDTWSRFIFGEGEIARTDGINVTINPKASPKERAKAIEVARVNPPPVTRSGGTIWSGPDKQFGMEIQFQKKAGEGEFCPREPDEKGFFNVSEGETYQIILRSNAPFETAVKLSIDGIAWDTFSKFADGKTNPGTSLVVVSPGKETVVRGWPISLDKSFAFDVGNLPKIASSRQDKIGIVTAEFHACWKKNETPPPGDEKVMSRRSSLGTAAVREQQDNFELVERQIGNQLRGAVTIRYGE